MPIFNIHHITRYEYDRPVKESTNEIKIYPFQCPDQETLQHELLITGHPEVQVFQDYWGNRYGSFNVLPVHQQLVIESKLIVRTTAPSQLRINFHGSWQQLQDETNTQLLLLELASSEPIAAQERINEIARSVQEKAHSVAATVEAASEYIFKHFKYIKGITTIETTVDEVLEHQAGVCQDFAHLLLKILRTLGVPSRYVSGYICPNKNGMRGEGATHAWIEAWIPQYGWAGIDPTNNVWVTNNHVKLSVGRHFNDCTPVKGTFKGPAKQKLSVFVSVGYEDGHVFEDLNNVDTYQQQTDNEMADSFSAQQ
ncbi:transglutaminase-like putative cysteine protease [Filimonas zeae]|uniref:Transglutaminase n=1 Tax=Filimonas zeae TaxID=1737353 RepID=A0A917MXH3_9BACT|nr:transglutaminase family protein [Filimonas zeae]MDR6341537.1 transglutaminase-like putative cysteine protease [Filimonas zeae]GGH75387.1 transglutaminase [Filimonas zeae]